MLLCDVKSTRLLEKKLISIGHTEISLMMKAGNSIFKNLSAVISFTMLSGMGIALPKFLAVCKSKKKVFLYFFSAAYIILIISIILFCILFLFIDFLNTLIFFSNDI